MYPETFDEYQEKSAATILHPPLLVPPLVYYTLAINGESGELAEKVKKIYRDQGGKMADVDREAIIIEVGDVLWYLTRLCEVVGVTLSTAARLNTVKLESRAARGTTQGSGDNR